MSRALHIGEDLLAADGSRLGTVDRLVVDERAHRVTHVVVAGRLVPTERLRDAGPDGLATDLNAAEVDALPSAGELVPPPERWRPPGGYTLGNFLAIAEALIGQSPYVPPVHVGAEPDAQPVHEITEGSPVWSGDRRLGRVERVLTDDSGEVTGLVVDREGALAGSGLLAASRIIEVVGNNVHTDLGEQERLPDYTEG